MGKRMAETDHTLSPAAANVAGAAMAVALFGLCLAPHGLLWGWSTVRGGMAALFAWPVLLGVVAGGGAVHEGLHALGFRWFGGAPWPQIRVTFLGRALAPATHCQAAVRVGAYRWATALPGLVLGVLPAALGSVAGLAWLTLFGATMSSLAAGDVLVLWRTRGLPPDAWVEDHPSRVGCRRVAGPDRRS